MSTDEKDWKLKLRYGKLETPYKHFTVLAEGVAENLEEGFSCPPGNAIMGMKIWASSEDEASEIIQDIGENIGFTVDGRIEIYKSEPIEPPTENPYAYDINFTPFNAD